MEFKPFFRGLLPVLFLLISISASAMEGTGIAFRVSLSGKIYRQLGFLIEEDIRPQKDFKQLEWFLSTAEVNYQVKPYLRLGGGYMSLAKYKSPQKLRNRYYFYALANYRFGAFKLSVRERFQSTYRRHTSEPNNYLRSMLMGSYDIGKSPFSLFAFVECFNQAKSGSRFRLDKVRYSAGVDYHMNKKNEFQLYYRYHTFRVTDPVNYRNYIGACYLHRF